MQNKFPFGKGKIVHPTINFLQKQLFCYNAKVATMQVIEILQIVT